MAKKPNFGLERRERANAKAARKAAKAEAKAAKTEQRKETKTDAQE